jgi:hypothetical protein
MNSFDVDERIRAALVAQADQVTEADLRPASRPTADRAHVVLAPRWRRRWLPPLLAAAAVVAVAAATIAVVEVVQVDRVQPAHTPTPVPPTHTAQTPFPTTTPSGTVPTEPTPSTSTSPPIGFDLGYQPLYPFAAITDARAWQASYRSGGHQPWHLDAGETALAFTRGKLGFTELDTITSRRVDGDGAHIGVGYVNPNGIRQTAAVLHLVRFGADPDSPWEVVGSDDTTFSLETPDYGSVVRSPMTVGGHITGVDESIRVSIYQLSSSAALGTTCCTPAGGVNQPWSTTVSFSAATDPVITIVASTGGHLLDVETFAIQGVRV